MAFRCERQTLAQICGSLISALQGADITKGVDNKVYDMDSFYSTPNTMTWVTVSVREHELSWYNADILYGK